MTSRKRNDPFDLAASDDDDQDKGYDSAADEEAQSKGALRSAKRRRVNDTDNLHGLDSDDSDLDVASDSEDERPKGQAKAKKPTTRAATAASGDEDEDEDEEDAAAAAAQEDIAATASSLNKKKSPLLKKDKKNKTGVVYLSSLPPHLKPFALKNLIEARGFGPITRVFLTPETKKQRRSTTNKRKTYADGWLEFASKKTAKICAEALNGNIIGGRKGGFYHDDILNLKYLRGFKWSDLQEQISRERSEREARQRAEDSKARKEDKVFLEGVERGKVLDGMRRKNEEKERRRLEKQAVGGAAEGAAGAAAAGKEKKDANGNGNVKVRRVFRQNEVKLGRDKSTDDFKDLGAETKRVLGKIF
ncbi:hypothetical protein ASPACDRAFT_124041 [Aspergillus aculeatus ATCC 16872]|uniref:Pre-rRNA-processing protein ESF2 n=1 Tax=Aspergillus aculeatus (strain ATCC 16872 / CBS 172.66 / WB 5094) TaxID=690307 RepID=A0A1L9WM04_ASPA1|nr:uncharacterized protein ASPACDRAFT_124041 [Aspergillus aculeatus ATCC 16872]OJJ97197.1 hypothetical protein ASPACDRAFT_124041 [Aspergillus aculeatus ATCC 16872]